MKTIQQYCLHLLKSIELEDKLLPVPAGLVDDCQQNELITKPGRAKQIQFSDRKSKIPRLEHLNQRINRAITLHHFANHELMAIELFAYFILRFPELPESYKRETLKSIRDEQKHFQLYRKRMNELGLEFGDRPLNYIFWKYLPSMQTPQKFSALFSLSFEGANLDYACIYQSAFEKFADQQSAQIMKIVFQDEIKHVRRGLNLFHSYKPKEKSDWQYYNELITYPFTPRRAKGYIYFPETRLKAGLDKEFSEKLAEYQDEYSNRKPYRIPEIIYKDLQEKNGMFEG